MPFKARLATPILWIAPPRTTMRTASEALSVQIGIATDRGMRAENEDFAACLPPAPGRPGFTAAVADGVGGSKGGRVAAETVMRLFLDAQDALNPLRGVKA